MKFPSNWYVPALKSKPGEFEALRQLFDAGQDRFTPVVEVVEQPPEADDEDEEPAKGPVLFPGLAPKKRVPPTPEEHIQSKMAGLREALGGRLAYIDPHEVAALGGGTGAGLVFDNAERQSLNFIPVVGLDRHYRDTLAANRHTRNGLAIRIVSEDLKRAPTLARAARDIVVDSGCSWESVDILLDAEELPEVPAGQQRKLTALLEFVGRVQCRNSVLIASAMPKSLRRLPHAEDSLVARREWILWRELRARYPGAVFGDHGIQHSAGVELSRTKRPGLPPIAIRYTQSDAWLILKGPARGPGVSPSEEYPILAGRLFNSKAYRSAFHCQGCREIAMSSQHQLSSGGQPRTWRRIGAVHHITTVLEQLRRERGA